MRRFLKQLDFALEIPSSGKCDRTFHKGRHLNSQIYMVGPNK